MKSVRVQQLQQQQRNENFEQKRTQLKTKFTNNMAQNSWHRKIFSLEQFFAGFPLPMFGNCSTEWDRVFIMELFLCHIFSEPIPLRYKEDSVVATAPSPQHQPASWSSQAVRQSSGFCLAREWRHRQPCNPNQELSVANWLHLTYGASSLKRSQILTKIYEL